MRAQDDGTTYHRIQIMRIGDFKVLVDTVVDAIDYQDQPVEIKQGNPKYFGTKLMFQMISSGSRFVLYLFKNGSRYNFSTRPLLVMLTYT